MNHASSTLPQMLDGVVGWIDFNQDERDRVDAVLGAFRDRGMLDELGFGRIRDSFSDLLAPGVSTLHTRVRYYLFIPWIFQKLEAKRIPAAKFRQQLEAHEVLLIDALVRGGDDEGIIGRRSRENLTRFPSEIYWNGLRIWGILQFDGSHKEYIRNVDALYDHRDSAVSTSDGVPVSRLQTSPWHPGLPQAPDRLLDRTSFSLRSEEADYLVEQIQRNVSEPASLLSMLTHPDQIRDISDIGVPWNNRIIEEAPDPLRSTLEHARNFALLTRGANLTYNLLLTEKKGLEKPEAEMQEELGEWISSTLHPWKDTLESWDWDSLRAVLSRASGHSVNFESTVSSFLHKWREVALRASGISDFRSSTVQRLIRDREQQVKGTRARLSNRHALEDWDGKASGTGLQTYRWRQVRRFVTDIAASIDS